MDITTPNAAIRAVRAISRSDQRIRSDIRALSVREAAERYDTSKSAVARPLKQLQESGFFPTFTSIGERPRVLSYADEEAQKRILYSAFVNAFWHSLRWSSGLRILSMRRVV